MTPTQLRSFATVVRQGSVRAAAAELKVTEAAVSANVAALRRELDDRLYRASRYGLTLTPGGMRLAHRAVEILGLHEQARREIGEARDGSRLLRIAATSLFAEYAAPGLIELFSARADDLAVELYTEPSQRFPTLLAGRSVDVAIGPSPAGPRTGLPTTDFLRYDMITVAAPAVAGRRLDEAVWCLGPSAAEPDGITQFMVKAAGVSEDHQRIYPSNAAALEEVRNGRGVGLAPSFAVTDALRQGSLEQIQGPTRVATGTWAVARRQGPDVPAVAEELIRFVSTPRAIQAMLTGSGSGVGRFKPSVHITLWS